MNNATHTGPFYHLWSDNCHVCENTGCSWCDDGKHGYGRFLGTDEQLEANRQAPNDHDLTLMPTETNVKTK